MADLYPVLSRLDLAQYIPKFHEEGFETWETVLDITESDLEALGVKLGHRRILQKEIAHTRGVSLEQWTSSASRSRQSDVCRVGGQQDSTTDGKSNMGAGGKRKYRRHPKPDESAPERPPSAYVIFSNNIREELKPENLSFTAIAKRVGERWQDIPAEDKEPYESEATSAKEKYHAEMSEYKTTRSYREYQQYLVDFKAKNASNSDGKRPKLAEEESATSSGSAISHPDTSPSVSSSSDLRHARLDSMGSGGRYSTTSGPPSPARPSYTPISQRGGIASIIPMGNASPGPISPSTPSLHSESSTGPFSQISHVRPSIETHSERMTPGFGQHTLPRAMPLENRKEVFQQQTAPSTASSSNIDPRLSQGGISPAGSSRRSNRFPSGLYHDTSDSSSKSSIGSNLSRTSTSASSLQYSPRPFAESTKVPVSLPPLSTVGPTSASGRRYADPAARPGFDNLVCRTNSSNAHSQNSQFPFNPSSTTGMKFESLQLPLPYNISFGQHPLPRPTNEDKLANVFDLQDIPRERNSLRNLTLEHGQGSVTPTLRQGLPEPRHPRHHPSLPKFPAMALRDHDTPEPILHPNADPLSVLAYAGRIVGRENHSPT